MHAEARGYVAGVLAGQRYDLAVEVGGRWINGGVRDLIDCAQYIALDLHDGPGVDIVADARDWTPPRLAGLLVCCEVLEHADDAAGVVKACLAMLAPGGRAVFTCAGPGRDPHSGLDGGPVRPGEHYANVDPADMRAWLAELDQVDVVHYPSRGDLYATGVVPA